MGNSADKALAFCWVIAATAEAVGAASSVSKLAS
jgi:hypothetical protein